MPSKNGTLSRDERSYLRYVDHANMRVITQPVSSNGGAEARTASSNSEFVQPSIVEAQERGYVTIISSKLRLSEKLEELRNFWKDYSADDVKALGTMTKTLRRFIPPRAEDIKIAPPTVEVKVGLDIEKGDQAMLLGTSREPEALLRVEQLRAKEAITKKTDEIIAVQVLTIRSTHQADYTAGYKPITIKPEDVPNPVQHF